MYAVKLAVVCILRAKHQGIPLHTSEQVTSASLRVRCRGDARRLTARLRWLAVNRRENGYSDKLICVYWPSALWRDERPTHYIGDDVVFLIITSAYNKRIATDYGNLYQPYNGRSNSKLEGCVVWSNTIQYSPEAVRYPYTSCLLPAFDDAQCGVPERLRLSDVSVNCRVSYFQFPIQSVFCHNPSLEGVTAMMRGLHAGLCHAFLV